MSTRKIVYSGDSDTIQDENIDVDSYDYYYQLNCPGYIEISISQATSQTFITIDLDTY